MQRHSALIDTGAIIAILERNDKWHRSCLEAIAQLNRPLLTSEAVLTELFHLVPTGRQWMEQTWNSYVPGCLLRLLIFSSEFPELHRLMSQYWDKSIDFADATLVYLAERELINTILTIDSDFQTYRKFKAQTGLTQVNQKHHGTRKFRVLPSECP